MARVDYIQTNFTAGEISPRLLGRVDEARFNALIQRLVAQIPDNAPQ